MVVRIAPFVALLAAFGEGGAVRLTGDADSDAYEAAEGGAGTDTASACLSWLQEKVIPLSTYRDTFSPVVAGVYELRATDGSGYLGMVGGKLVVQDKAGENTGHFRWRADEHSTSDFKQHVGLAVPNPGALPPAFSLWNEAGKMYLIGTPNGTAFVKDYAGPDTQWADALDPNEWVDYTGRDNQWFVQLAPVAFGTVYGLHNRAYGWYGRTTDEEGWQVLGPQTLTPASGVWELVRVDGHQALDWDSVKEMPLMTHSITGMRWKDVCPHRRCAEIFQLQVDRMQRLGRLDVNEFGESTDNKVRGFCDWDLVEMRTFVETEAFIMDLAVSSQPCASRTFHELRDLLREAVMNVCFQDCVDDMKKEIPVCPEDLDELMSEPVADDLFSRLLNTSEACRQVPSDTLEHLGEFVLVQRCHMWALPSPLWTEEDKSMGSSVDPIFHQTVCSVYHVEAATSKNVEDIVQVGTCPSGTKCQCPATWAFTRKTTPQYRTRTRANMFIEEGSAELPSLFSSFTMDSLTKVAGDVVLPGILAGTLTTAALGTALVSTTVVIASLSSMIQSLFKKYQDWTCAKTVGCWPVLPSGNWRPWPKPGGAVCRVPQEAVRGGSRVWFLPPPGLMLSRVGLFRRSCRFQQCEQHIGEAARAQPVGFQGSIKQHVYNCQPLLFEAMNLKQQTAFVDALAATGVVDEYNMSLTTEAATTEALSWQSALKWGENPN